MRHIFFDGIPDELVVEVMLYLPLADRFRFSMVAQRFQALAKNTISLEYLTEQECLGVIRNQSLSSPPVTISECLRKLRDWDNSWTDLSWRRSQVSLPGRVFTYEFSGGIFGQTLNTPGQPLRTKIKTLHFIDLPTAEHPEPIFRRHDDIDMIIRDFTFDPAQDLMALIEDASNGTPFFRLHLRTVSENLPHPLASMSVLDIPFRTIWKPVDGGPEPIKFTIQIFDNLLGIASRIYSANEDLIHIWNWTTGEELCWLRSGATHFDDFTFLSSADFLVAHGGSDETRLPAGLDIYTLASPESTKGVGANLQAILELPPLADNFCADLSIHCNPPTTYRQKLHAGSSMRCRSQSQLHQIDPGARLLSFCFTAIRIPTSNDVTEVLESFMIFLRQQDIRNVLGRLREDTHGLYTETIPWERWGPPVTRWLPYMPTYGWAVCTRGYRHASLLADLSQEDDGTEPEHRLCILDFNPITTARFPNYRSRDTGRSIHRIVNRPSVIPAEPYFKRDVVSTLPYFETTSVGTINAQGVMIDDQRILVMKMGENFVQGLVSSLEVLAFS